MTNIIKFHDTEMHTIIRDGEAYVRGTDIARALGYQDPSQVAKLYRRYEDDFLPQEVLKVDLTLSLGNKTKALFFNKDGATLIAMLAKTDKGGEFRRWIVGVLKQHTTKVRAHTRRLPQKYDANTDPLAHRPIARDELRVAYIRSKELMAYIDEQPHQQGEDWYLRQMAERVAKQCAFAAEMLIPEEKRQLRRVTQYILAS